MILYNSLLPGGKFFGRLPRRLSTRKVVITTSSKVGSQALSSPAPQASTLVIPVDRIISYTGEHRHCLHSSNISFCYIRGKAAFAWNHVISYFSNQKFIFESLSLWKLESPKVQNSVSPEVQKSKSQKIRNFKNLRDRKFENGVWESKILRVQLQMTESSK